MSIYIPAAVLNHIHEAVAVLDTDHRILYVNERFEKIFSLDRTRCTGLKPENILKFPTDFNWAEIYALEQKKTILTQFRTPIFDIEIQMTAIPLPSLDSKKTFVLYFSDETSTQTEVNKNFDYNSADRMEEISYIASLPEMANSSTTTEEFLSRTQLKLIRGFRFHAMSTWINTQGKELTLAGFQTDGQVHKTTALSWVTTYKRHIDETMHTDMPKKFQADGFQFLVVPHKKRSSMFAVSIIALPENKPAQESQIRLIQIFGHQLAVVLENTKLHTDSTQDALTKVYNAKFFHNRISSEFIIAESTESPLSLLFLDVDHFKKINDTYGHTFGDLVLSEVAKVMKNTCRPSDLVCRYGGEEFAILLIDTNENGALIVAEKIRAAIEAHIPDPTEPQIKVSISIGVASFPTSAHTKEELIEHADKALYIAKRAGRNRTEHYHRP